MSLTLIDEDINRLAGICVDAAFAVHKELGPGLLESAYRECLAYELNARNVSFRKEAPVPLPYKNIVIDVGFRADIIVAERLLIELKAVEALLPIHEAQIITYLKILKMPLGLLINFNETLLKNGLHRKLNIKRT